jgi:hypothetical protein
VIRFCSLPAISAVFDDILLPLLCCNRRDKLRFRRSLYHEAQSHIVFGGEPIAIRRCDAAGPIEWKTTQVCLSHQRRDRRIRQPLIRLQQAVGNRNLSSPLARIGHSAKDRLKLGGLMFRRHLARSSSEPPERQGARPPERGPASLASLVGNQGLQSLLRAEISTRKPVMQRSAGDAGEAATPAARAPRPGRWATRHRARRAAW